MSTANPFNPGAQYVPPNPNAPILTARPAVSFLHQAVQPPSQVYVSLGDVLRITTATVLAGEVVTVNYRLLLPNGELVAGQATIPVNGIGVVNIHDEPLAEGFLLSASCSAALATDRGSTFVRMFLTDPSLGSGQPTYMLMADYVTTFLAPGHPNGRNLAPSEGPGTYTQIILGNPAAGADWSFTFPTNTRSRVQAISALLSTSVAVANRTPLFRFLDPGSNVLGVWTSTSVQAASLGWRYTWSAAPIFAPATGTQFEVGFPPGTIFDSTFTVQTATLGIQAADQWSQIRIFYEQWLNNV